MKLRPINEKEVVVELYGEEEETYKRWLAQLQEALPKLEEIWEKVEMIRFSPELLREGFFLQKFRGLSSMPVGVMPKVLIYDYGEQRPGCPADIATLTVMLKILFLAPREVVLKQEKERRKSKYSSEIRDNNVRSALKKAEYRAIRNADTCVARAERAVLEYLRTKPEFLIPHLLMRNAVQQLLATRTIRPGS